ncbi:hypothetical protein TWF970_003845 [Orbilia oligospora]|uniref:Uncharacterized protein n=1 Tax=Orbilia oligospora TaxID=2813651 RepID=A0A7C8RE89_ORBOL|nr:hypothetical protein TWF970_003845 [Orbilia oligospora]
MSAPLEHQDALKTQPPRIPKPKQTGHNLTNKILQEAFEVDYYIDKTENWGHITMPASIRILKKCCNKPLQKYISEFEPEIDRFKDQSDRIKAKIYNEFVENLRTIKLCEDFREVLFDMLESTRERRWLFVWIVNQLLRAWQQRKTPMEGSSLTYSQFLETGLQDQSSTTETTDIVIEDTSNKQNQLKGHLGIYERNY